MLWVYILEQEIYEQICTANEHAIIELKILLFFLNHVYFLSSYELWSTYLHDGKPSSKKDSTTKISRQIWF